MDLQARPRYVEYYRNEPFTLPRRNTPILSSFRLQQLLFYNALFDIPFLVIHLILFFWRFNNTDNWKAQYIAPIGLVMLLLVEPFRVYSGWIGNVKERTSNLTTFLFLTFFFSPIIALFLMGIQAPLLPLDRVFGWLYILFFVFQFILGIMTIKRVIQYKTIRFKIELPVPTEDDEDYQGNDVSVPQTTTLHAQPAEHNDSMEISDALKWHGAQMPYDPNPNDSRNNIPSSNAPSTPHRNNNPDQYYQNHQTPSTSSVHSRHNLLTSSQYQSDYNSTPSGHS